MNRAKPTPAKPVADVIAELLKTQAGLDLPVRLRAWDGSEAGPENAPVLIARSPRALRRILWRPGELGLARAYISGDLDVEGDLTEGLRLFFGARPARRRSCGWPPSRSRPGCWNAPQPARSALPARSCSPSASSSRASATGSCTGSRPTRPIKASRPGYADYVARTSGFIPLPPKRHVSAPAQPGRG